MSQSHFATVVSVAAPPGGGKTTLSRMISAKLPNAAILHFDDYETFTARNAAEIEAWIGRGAPFADITAPKFGEDLAKLRAGGASYIVVDAPVGRAYPAMAAMIDFMIFVDTPLDVALARVIKAEAARAAQEASPAAQSFVAWLEGYLDEYTRFTRRICDIQRARVMPQADLILDGTLPPLHLAELAIAAIADRLQ